MIAPRYGRLLEMPTDAPQIVVNQSLSLLFVIFRIPQADFDGQRLLQNESLRRVLELRSRGCQEECGGWWQGVALRMTIEFGHNAEIRLV